MKVFKKLGVFFLAFVVFASLMPTVETGASQTTRQRLAEAEAARNAARSQVHGTQNLLTGMRSEMNDLLAEMQAYDERLEYASEALMDIELALLGTELRIEEAEEDLAIAQVERDMQEELLRARLRAMHESGSVGYLEVLFQAASFSDFLMRMEYVRAVAEFDQELLNRLEETEARVAGNIETLGRERVLISDLHFQQERAIQALYDALEEREVWFASMAEDESRLALLLDLQEAEQRALEEEFGQIQTQLRAEEAEIERQRRAEQQRQNEAQRQATLAHLNSFNGDFTWPIPTHSRISSPFGTRTHPISGRQEHHSGIDVPAPVGTRIIAAQEGVVRLSGRHGGYGITVIIDHADGYSTLYAHNSQNLVSVGQHVSRGQHIANVGSTGVSTGPHLHFEIRQGGRAVNPMRYFGG